MDAKYLEIVALTWDLTKKQNALLSVAISTAHEMAKCLMEDRKPTPVQVAAWDAINAQVSHSMCELTAAFASVERAVNPLFRFDA
jgi:hypothetical protein